MFEIRATDGESYHLAPAANVNLDEEIALLMNGEGRFSGEWISVAEGYLKTSQIVAIRVVGEPERRAVEARVQV